MPAGDAGGDVDLGGGDAGGDTPAAGGDESPLLAVPPGSRDDVRTYEKSTYRPVKNDRRKDSGPRKRNYAAKRSAEKSSSTVRNVSQAQRSIAYQVSQKAFMKINNLFII